MTMLRRDFVGAIGAMLAARPLSAFAQALSRPPLVAAAGTGQWTLGPSWQQFFTVMTASGYLEGRDFTFAPVFEGGDPSRRSEVVRELVGLKPDVIVTGNTTLGTAIAGATSSIPIILAVADELGTARLVANFTRPEGNITGILQNDASAGHLAKNLELIKEVAPSAKRIGLALNLGNPSHAGAFQNVADAAARALGLGVVVADIRRAADVERAWAALMREGIDAAVWQVANIEGIIEAAAAARVPVIYRTRANVEAGGLMSYGVDTRGNYPKAAEYVVRLLQGARVADLPVVPPSTFELAINEKTARAMGISFPLSILARADVVIE